MSRLINQYPITTWIDGLMKGIFLCNFCFTRPRFQSTPKKLLFIMGAIMDSNNKNKKRINL